MMNALSNVLLALLMLSCCASDTADQELYTRVLGKSKSNHDWLVQVRRGLHQIPEQGRKEFKTSAFIRKTLETLDIRYKQGFATTGIVAQIGTGEPIVVLRADMDALPIQEPEDFENRSQHEGWMHACGHDSHVTMLLGAAKLLKLNFEKEVTGTVKFVFQPDEEGGAGGDDLIKEGGIEGAAAAFGLHVWPTLPSGVVGTRPGTIMAGALSFNINITGRGGHAALPHLNVDPIVASASIISSLQTLVSRETSPLDSAVLSITLLRAGEAYNVIPDSVLIGGTIRALTPSYLLHLRDRLNEIVPLLAEGMGCSSIIDWRPDEQPLYPPVVNDQAMAKLHASVAAGLLGKDNVVEVEPTMGAEDFSFFCQMVPCSFSLLGISDETLGTSHKLHNAMFKLDEGVLHKGAAIHAATAIQYFKQSSVPKGKDEL